MASLVDAHVLHRKFIGVSWDIREGVLWTSASSGTLALEDLLLFMRIDYGAFKQLIDEEPLRILAFLRRLSKNHGQEENGKS